MILFLTLTFIALLILLVAAGSAGFYSMMHMSTDPFMSPPKLITLIMIAAGSAMITDVVMYHMPTYCEFIVFIAISFIVLCLTIYLATSTIFKP